MKSYLKKLINGFGYEIYKANCLPLGIDFERDIKKISQSFRVDNIFDVGANIGQTAIRFSKFFPDAKVFSFEPIHTTFRELQQNTAHLTKVSCWNYAFGSQEGEFTVHLQSNSQLNSLLSEVNTYSSQSELVKVKTIDQFCSENSIDEIDILKTDTEGFDLEVIKGANKLLSENKVKIILSEVGFIKADKRHTLFSDINDYLVEKGFRFCGLYDLRHFNVDGHLTLAFCNALFVSQTVKTELGIAVTSC